jgi:peptidyl-prolyl cis-trans isomerase A (cyclophilin A)
MKKLIPKTVLSLGILSSKAPRLNTAFLSCLDCFARALAKATMRSTMSLVTAALEAKLVRSFALLAMVLSVTFSLTSCGAGAQSTPLKNPDIQSSQLAYGITVTFFVGVTQVNQGVNFTASLCNALTPVTSPSPLFQAFSCQPTGSGTLVFSALDATGKVLLTKNFTIPAPQVTMVTSAGTIVYELNPNAAPITVKNFLQYVSSGFYTNIIFHRVIPGFVVQGGGFVTGMNQLPPPFAPITLETPNGLSNLTGSLAMARTTEPNSATSQFYINVADNTSLDYVSSSSPGYAVFGKVVTGLDVVNAIAAVPTQTVNGNSNVPVTDVTITSATRTQ